MRRKIIIAQMLLASSGIKSVLHSHNREDDFIYKVSLNNGKKYEILIKPGSTIAIKVGDEEYETLSIGVPHDIVQILDDNEKEFHLSLTGYLKDSDAFLEQISEY